MMYMFLPYFFAVLFLKKYFLPYFFAVLFLKKYFLPYFLPYFFLKSTFCRTFPQKVQKYKSVVLKGLKAISIIKYIPGGIKYIFRGAIG